MPFFLPFVLPALLSAGAQIGTGALASRSASRASNRAADAQLTGLREQMAFERERLAEERKQWEAMQEFERRRWDSRAPFRAAAERALGNTEYLLNEGRFDWFSPSNAGRQG